MKAFWRRHNETFYRLGLFAWQLLFGAVGIGLGAALVQQWPIAKFFVGVAVVALGVVAVVDVLDRRYEP